MTKREILALAFKIMGVYFLIQSIHGIFVSHAVLLSNANIMHNVNPEARMYSSAAILLFMMGAQLPVVLLSMVLLGKNEAIAERLVKTDSAVSWTGPVDREAIFSLALKVIGAIMLSLAMPLLVRLGAEAVILFPKLKFHVFSFNGLNLLGEMARLLVGGYLVFDGSHVTKLACYRKPAAN